MDADTRFRRKGRRSAMYRSFIVEDDAGLAQAMKKQIASWGNEVFCAEIFRILFLLLWPASPIWC